MKRILCPVDFTPAANNAVEYAANIAKQVKAKLVLFQFVQVPDLQDVANMNAGMTDGVKLREEESIDRLQGYAELVEEKFSIACDVLVKSGISGLGDSLSDIDEREHFDLLVMGTNGAENLRQYLFGTNTYKVIKKVNCPVLLVPETFSFRPPQHIVFATDYEEKDAIALKNVLEFTKAFNPEVTVIHVSKKPGVIGDEVYRSFRNILEDELENTTLHFQRLIDKEVFAGIDKFMNSKPAELLVLLSREHSFAERIFHESTIKKLSFIASYPILVDTVS